MFQNLSQRLTEVFDRLRRRAALTEEDVVSVLREIRIALLEADVSLTVVKSFIEEVKEKAIGQDVLKSVSPAQMIVKIVHDYLVELLSGDNQDLTLNVAPPAVMMMVGLQGAGKTTATAKLALYISQKLRKKVLMVSTDVYRPAAREQLAILGQGIQVESVSILKEEKPVEIVKRALSQARLEGYDVLLVDTAGRLHIDDAMMEELKILKTICDPIETLLVLDSMTGQDAVHVAQHFHAHLNVTGSILTRVDGDARGGAALSLRSITGRPIKFVSIGEKVDQFDLFHPDRIAGRILDMGDVVTLVEKAMETFDREEAEKISRKMGQGQFDLEDFATQLSQVSKMGGVSKLLSFLPGVGKIQDKIDESGVNDKMVQRQLAVIRSMTKKERRDYKILNASRRRRIALGAGVTVADVNRLLKQFQDTLGVMKRMKKWGSKGMQRQGLQNLFSPKR